MWDLSTAMLWECDESCRDAAKCWNCGAGVNENVTLCRKCETAAQQIAENNTKKEVA